MGLVVSLKNTKMKVFGNGVLSVVMGVLVFKVPTRAAAFVRSSSTLLFVRPLPVKHSRTFASVTGRVYTSEDTSAPIVKLFTKEGCTLCDKVKDVLMEVRDAHPHSLEQIDITDDVHQEWYSKYKYDIPVLHLNDKYWIKHRTTVEEATEGLLQAKSGTFAERNGEPDAGAMERRQSEREGQKR